MNELPEANIPPAVRSRRLVVPAHSASPRYGSGNGTRKRWPLNHHEAHWCLVLKALRNLSTPVEPLIVPCLTASLLIFGSGCGSNGPSESGIAGANVGTQTRRAFDVGVVEKDFIYDCEMEGLGAKTVKSVVKDCSCSTVHAREGDVLNLGHPIRVSISTRNKRWGKHSQTVGVVFADDSRLLLTLNYDFRPPPYAEPSYLILRPGVAAELKVYFSDEADARVTGIKIPQEIRWTKRRGEQKGCFILRFTVGEDDGPENEQGFVEIDTSSKHAAGIRLPYLVLHH